MNSFAFQSPGVLVLLLLLIPVAWLVHRAQQRRSVIHKQLGGELRSPWRERLRLLAVTLLIFALARPGISPRRESISRSGRDVVFVLDVSQSMLAEDVYPSRLEAAKNGIRDALDSFRSQRVALVIYAGSANILCPLTHDYEFARYMLDQAVPRAVDFGGTTLLSATEKCVDNLLSDERAGMQDLVVLTDGEEHGPQNQRVADLLTELETGLLVVGLGDSTSGSRVPIMNDEGAATYLKHDGQYVTTRLNEEGLRELYRLTSNSNYVAAGTAAFDLAGVYSNFSADKPAASTAGAETYVVYRELGLFLVGVAVLLLLLAERISRFGASHGTSGKNRDDRRSANPRWRLQRKKAETSVQAMIVVAFFALVSQRPTFANEPVLSTRFDDAMQLQQSGDTAGALESYGEIQSDLGFGTLSSAQIATLRFNQGLCHLSLASGESEPRSALTQAEAARTCFLEACQLSPGFERAAHRLDPTASLIAEYTEQIEEEDKQEQELQKQMEELIERLRKLQQRQTVLRNEVPQVPKQARSRRRGQPPPPPPVEPKTADSDSKRFAKQQAELREEAGVILNEMQALDEVMMPPMPPGSDSQLEPVSVLREPVRLMSEVIAAQEIARTRLQQWNTWRDGRDQQLVAVNKIQEILDLLSNDNMSDSEDGEWDEYDEYDEMMEASDSEEGMMSSMQGQGDFASGSQMQALPIPNYSVDDILMEEQGSLQFRQQQRAKGNESKVEKDW